MAGNEAWASAPHHLAQYRTLVGGRGGTIALGAIRRILSDLVRDELDAALHRKGAAQSAEEIPREFIVQHIVGAYMAVLT
jgi:hypothetical protein